MSATTIAEGPTSQIRTINYHDDAIKTNVVNVKATHVTSTSVELSWTNPADLTTPVQSYKLELYTSERLVKQQNVTKTSVVRTYSMRKIIFAIF